MWCQAKKRVCIREISIRFARRFYKYGWSRRLCVDLLHHCLQHFNLFNDQPIVAEKSVYKAAEKVAGTAAK